MTTAYIPYGYGRKPNVASDVANYVETRLRDLVPDLEKDDRFRVYGVPGEGYVEITALTSDDDLEYQIKHALPDIDQELRRTGVSTAMFARLEPRVPADAEAELDRWIWDHLDSDPEFIKLAGSFGTEYEIQEEGPSDYDISADGTWTGYAYLIVAYHTEDDTRFFRKQFVAQMSGTISRDGDIEGEFKDWGVSEPPTD